MSFMVQPLHPARMARCLSLVGALCVSLLAGAPASGQMLPPIGGCSENARDLCLYRSSETYTPATVDLVLPDAARDNHPVPIRIRYPVGAQGARPVVIWNHGGGTTHRDGPASSQAGRLVSAGQQGSVRRSESFARAGYVVIHIGRMQPDTLSPAQLLDCTKVGVIAAGVVNPDNTALNACRTWIGWHLYGPQNVAFVVQVLQLYQAGMLPGFDGTLDRERIVVGGWSGGSEAPLNIAGAYQEWTGPGGRVRLDPVAVPGVAAFFTDSPRGPSWAGFGSGFEERSAYGIDSRPFLTNTARDDRGGDDGAVVSRTAHFFGAAKGDKVLSYSWFPADQGGPNHGTMDINDSIDEATGEPATGCNTPLREAHCQALESLGVAFLDAKVRGIQAARDWLASGNFKVWTLDYIELYQR
jgi:hypothetical protein